MSVTVYSKPSCVQCTATYRALDQKGISYEVIDISNNTEGYQTVQDLGYRQIPVVVAANGDHWAGFRPDKIGNLG